MALNDRKILPEHEIIGILPEAAAAHSNAPDADDPLHEGVARLINRIIDDGNSVRRRQNPKEGLAAALHRDQTPAAP